MPHHERWEAGRHRRPRAVRGRPAPTGSSAWRCPRSTAAAGSTTSASTSCIAEEIQRAGVNAAGLGLTLHNDICLPYFLHLTDDEQKQRWLPGICSGELITAIAMTEPGIGSDLASMTTTAIRDGDHYVVNGSKTFITNGINADLVITAVKTDPAQRHRGMSLLVLERGMEGFERGRNLDKVGMHAQDTAELFFNDVRVPVANRLGDEGQGFLYARHQPAPGATVDRRHRRGRRPGRRSTRTLAYAKERKAFGQPIGIVPAQPLRAGRDGDRDRDRPELHRPLRARPQRRRADAPRRRRWRSGGAPSCRAGSIDAGVQLHGGYGYMTRVPDRPGLRRRPHHPHLRRHHGDHEGDHRQVAGAVTFPPRRA